MIDMLPCDTRTPLYGRWVYVTKCICKRIQDGSPQPVDDTNHMERVRLLIEKKIRNLEKRRNKLVDLKKTAMKGKELHEDQKVVGLNLNLM